MQILIRSIEYIIIIEKREEYIYIYIYILVCARHKTVAEFCERVVK